MAAYKDSREKYIQELKIGIKSFLSTTNKKRFQIAVYAKTAGVYNREISKLIFVTSEVISSFLQVQDAQIFSVSNVNIILKSFWIEFSTRFIRPVFFIRRDLIAQRYSESGSLPKDHPIYQILHFLNQFVFLANESEKCENLTKMQYCFCIKNFHTFIQLIVGAIDLETPPFFGLSHEDLIEICKKYDMKNKDVSPLIWNLGKKYLNRKSDCDYDKLVFSKPDAEPAPRLKRFSLSKSPNMEKPAKRQEIDNAKTEQLIERLAEGTIFESNIHETLNLFGQLLISIDAFCVFTFKILTQKIGHDDDDGFMFNQIMNQMRMDIIKHQITVMKDNPHANLIQRFGQDKTSYKNFIDSIGKMFLSDTTILKTIMEEQHSSDEEFNRLRILIDSFVYDYKLLI
jgi:hypothetical protein